ncbi:MAG: hypothetical protein JSS75_14105 [Bacteroidetes bacterium]|nr:hypothetical protein [Bacteroidota bacterium]
MNTLIPRIALILVFVAGMIFTYIESTYMRDHAASLGPKGSDVSFWMWAYRLFAVAFLFAAAFVLGSFFRR